MKKLFLLAMIVFLVLSILSGAVYALSGDVEASPNEQWTCAACELQENTGKFCTECGAMKPQITESGVWICSCGVENDGKFCTKCGLPKPSDTPLLDTQPKYICEKCGWEPKDLDNPPNYCKECGGKILVQWRCVACGHNGNTEKYCIECGQPKDNGVGEYICRECGWEPEDLENPPNFCPKCSDKFDENDELVICRWCEGEGKEICSTCMGKGIIYYGEQCPGGNYYRYNSSYGYYSVSYICKEGYTGEECIHCNGKGKVSKPLWDFSVPGHKN